ncbi:MAG TPA: carboxypeptidase-like regulatory domain-containing protein [Planctomycetota bacterium]
MKRGAVPLLLLALCVLLAIALGWLAWTFGGASSSGGADSAHAAESPRAEPGSGAPRAALAGDGAPPPGERRNLTPDPVAPPAAARPQQVQVIVHAPNGALILEAEVQYQAEDGEWWRTGRGDPVLGVCILDQVPRTGTLLRAKYANATGTARAYAGEAVVTLDGPAAEAFPDGSAFVYGRVDVPAGLAPENLRVMLRWQSRESRLGTAAFDFFAWDPEGLGGLDAEGEYWLAYTPYAPAIEKPWRVEVWLWPRMEGNAESPFPQGAFLALASETFQPEPGETRRVDLALAPPPLLTATIDGASVPLAARGALRHAVWTQLALPDGSLQFVPFPGLEGSAPDDGPLAIRVPEALLGQPVELRVRSGLFEAISKRLPLARGRNDLGHLRFQAPARLRGTVRDAVGGLAQGLDLALERLGPDGRPDPVARSSDAGLRMRVGADGAFAFEPLTPGRYQLLALAPAPEKRRLLASPLPVTVAPGATETVELALDAGLAHALNFQVLGIPPQASALPLTAFVRRFGATWWEGTTHAVVDGGFTAQIPAGTAAWIWIETAGEGPAADWFTATVRLEPESSRGDSFSIPAIPTRTTVAAPRAATQDLRLDLEPLEEAAKALFWAERGNPRVFQIAIPRDGSPRTLHGLPPGRYRAQLYTRHSGRWLEPWELEVR